MGESGLFQIVLIVVRMCEKKITQTTQLHNSLGLLCLWKCLGITFLSLKFVSCRGWPVGVRGKCFASDSFDFVGFLSFRFVSCRGWRVSVCVGESGLDCPASSKRAGHSNQ